MLAQRLHVGCVVIEAVGVGLEERARDARPARIDENQPAIGGARSIFRQAWRRRARVRLGGRPVVGRQTDDEMLGSSLCGEARPDQQDVMVGMRGGDHLGRGRAERARSIDVLTPGVLLGDPSVRVQRSPQGRRRSDD